MNYNYFSLIALFLFNQTVIAQTCSPDTIPSTAPTTRYLVNSKGTVLDKKTGLMWKQCSEGLSGAQCLGAPIAFTWQGALLRAQAVNASGFAGYKDWRLPNIKELNSITEYQCESPAVNTSVFPNTQYDSSYYWSSTHDDSNDVWVVHMDIGSVDNVHDEAYPGNVRLVRGR